MNKGLLVATILSISCSSFVFAEDACDETTLHGYMTNIKDEMRLMSSDVKAGDNDAAVQRVDTLISFFEKARNETPYKFSADNLQGGQLKEQTSEYTKVVDDTIVILKKLENALESGDTTQVKVLFGEIGGQRKLGHGSFKANC
jgi:cytochrome c556